MNAPFAVDDRRAGLVRAARAIAASAAEHAPALDVDGGYPADDVAALHAGGLLRAPLPIDLGGIGLGTVPDTASLLGTVLRGIGAGNLALGRLYEGHVNALRLLMRHGTSALIETVAAEVRSGSLSGVWNTDDATGLHLVAGETGATLRGRKILCSGAGHITRPVVTARDEAGLLRLVAPKLQTPAERADLSAWTPQGMRASATGAVDFSGVSPAPEEIFGAPDAYHSQPDFSAGAWRFAAVQQGGMEALLDALRQHLHQTGRGADPHQAARLGQAAIAVETARLWVERAALVAEAGGDDSDAIVAYVDLTRTAVERAALDLLEITQRSIGLLAFMRPNPVERIARDLATYLRQPAPDRALAGAGRFVAGQTGASADLWP